MARPRKATSLKKAQGTLQPCRTNLDEPHFYQISTLPDPPDFFNEESREIYYSTGLELISQGILTGVALPQFLHYCYFSGASIELAALVKQQGYYQHYKGQRVQNQNIKTLSMFAGFSRQFASDFGLTPATSSKVNATKKGGSKLDEFFTQ